MSYLPTRKNKGIAAFLLYMISLLQLMDHLFCCMYTRILSFQHYDKYYMNFCGIIHYHVSICCLAMFKYNEQTQNSVEMDEGITTKDEEMITQIIEQECNTTTTQPIQCEIQINIIGNIGLSAHYYLMSNCRNYPLRIYCKMQIEIP